MLKTKYLFEDFEQAKECLKHYDPEENSPDKLLHYFRISSNAVYPFRDRSSRKLCFLRLSPVEEKPEAEVIWEVRLIQWLNGQGFPAMKPVPMRDGRLRSIENELQ